MSFPKHVFKAYDIRGLVEGELSEELAYAIGRSFGLFLAKNGTSGGQVVVGRDMRETSPVYQKQVIKGLLEAGFSVVDIGLTTTPLFNFACAHYEEHVGGIMVTASHNPAEYNGFKMTLHNGLPVGKNSGMAEIEALAQAGKWGEAMVGGAVTTKDVLPDYLNRIFALVPPEKLKPLKVVLDCGNGMGATTFKALIERLPISIEYLYADPDGRFPNHEANPLKAETLIDLQKRVVETGADFGFALDGDADRVGLVDEKGQVVDASFVGALVGLEVLRQHSKGHMLYDLRSSAVVREVWEAGGATTEMSVVGHALIKKQMKETKAIFASELSLHLYYHDMYDVESSDLSLLYVLQLLSRENKPLSELVAPLKKYAHSGEINFEIHDKEEVLKRLDERYGAEATETSNIDGKWFRLPWGWMSARSSNTEPVLRLNLETPSSDMTGAKVAEVKSIIG